MLELLATGPNQVWNWDIITKLADMRPLTRETKAKVRAALLAGAQLKEAAEQTGVSESAASAVRRETRALVDGAALRADVTIAVAAYLRASTAALLAQAETLASREWIEAKDRQPGEVFSVASASRVIGDQLLRYLAAFGLSSE